MHISKNARASPACDIHRYDDLSNGSSRSQLRKDTESAKKSAFKIRYEKRIFGRYPDRGKTARCGTAELTIPSYKIEGQEHWIVASALHYTSGKDRLKAIQTWKGSLMRTAKMQDPNEDARARIVNGCHRTPRKEQKIHHRRTVWFELKITSYKN